MIQISFERSDYFWSNEIWFKFLTQLIKKLWPGKICYFFAGYPVHILEGNDRFNYLIRTSVHAGSNFKQTIDSSFAVFASLNCRNKFNYAIDFLCQDLLYRYCFYYFLCDINIFFIIFFMILLFYIIFFVILFCLLFFCDTTILYCFLCDISILYYFLCDIIITFFIIFFCDIIIFLWYYLSLFFCDIIIFFVIFLWYYFL